MDTEDKNIEFENEKLFLSIIENGKITTVFQPIISLRDGLVLGYEALSRGPQDTKMQDPQKLFEYAQKYGKLWELELLCRTKALEAVNENGKQIKLFLNVNPNIMHDNKFRQGFTKDYINKFYINTEDIIFEITEKEAIKNILDFNKTVQNYKDQNYKIAIDDAGAGYSGLNMISNIHPHFIKLDMNLIRDVDKDVTKQSLIKSMYEFATMTNTYLIAEGIETQKELIKLIEIGIHYGQGFFIQKPDALILPIEHEVSEIIQDANKKKNHLFGGKLSEIYISNISTPLKTITSNTKVSLVNDLINNDNTLPGFCITEDENLLGIITRNDLHLKLSGLYGYSLYANKPIKNIMSREFMCVDHKTPIDIVSKIAMQREHDKLYDFITITKDGKYYGIVTVKDLLEKTIQMEVLNAKHLNPLSELPGNLLIERHLEHCISTKKDFWVLYFDIDNFKAYNDVYGFEKGDLVIKSMTEILKKFIPRDEFIGHIGGDDFIAVLFQNDGIEDLCNKIILNSITH